MARCSAWDSSDYSVPEFGGYYNDVYKNAELNGESYTVEELQTFYSRYADYSVPFLVEKIERKN